MADPFQIPQISRGPVELDAQTPQISRPSLETGGADSPSFGQVLSETIGEVQRLQTEADDTIRRLVSGEIRDVTEAMVAVERADVAFNTMMAVRNRMVAAYEEVMRMQV